MSHWSSYTEQLREAGERVLAQLPSKDPQLVAETEQMLFATLSRIFVAVSASDPAHPAFVPELSLAFNLLAPNADTIYMTSYIEDSGVYRLRGTRGQIPIFNMTQISGIGPIKGDYDFDDIKLDADGRFELIVSAERPSDHAGNWWQLQSGTKGLMVRRMGYNWGQEIEPELTIDRLDVFPARPRPTAEELHAKFSTFAKLTEAFTLAFLNHVDGLENEGFVNKLKFIDYGEAVGLTGQFYYEGVFDIAEDEALILEVVPPKDARYWSVILADDIFATVDWINRQSSLNGAQAVADADGVYRLVVSRREPGVPNWLDATGYKHGAIQGRFTRFPAPSPTLPTLTKVKLADVRSHLPAATPQISREQRELSLRARREGWQRRRIW
ncbi:MAG: hypothetical protein JWM78_2741 [Verrucomicrobiaceae bacterium]|nr:hypothetical protein [Verrucomicrobiaceae bacterium]